MQSNSESADVGSASTASRLSAVDLFVGFHKIEGDLKSAMLAVNACMTEEGVFNQSVLAVSLTQLLELKVLPTLLLRTVLQVILLFILLIDSFFYKAEHQKSLNSHMKYLFYKEK